LIYCEVDIRRFMKRKCEFHEVDKYHDGESTLWTSSDGNEQG